MSLDEPERNKRLLRERRAAAQLRALPSALPGEEHRFDRDEPGLGSGFAFRSQVNANESPISHAMSPAERAIAQGGFSSQALGPTYLTYGPMLAEGPFVVEEWESMIYGANGTLYNNQYISIARFEGEEIAEFQEYNDSHHAWLIFGPPARWTDPLPRTKPKRRVRRGEQPAPPPEDEIELVFEVEQEFELDPRIIRDPVPSPSRESHYAATADGNKQLVRDLRAAHAAGDVDRVNGFYANGFRHFLAGERPFGWDHLPLEEIYAPLVSHIASPLRVWAAPPIADETRVVERWDSLATLDDGTIYNGWQCFVHEIRDGHIVQTREYLDTLHAWVTLGRWADWGTAPVPPRAIPRRSNLQGIAACVQYPTTFGPDLERWRPF